MQEDSVAQAQAALTEAAKAVLMMIAKTDQRETRMHESFDKELLALRNEVAQVRSEVAAIVHRASAQIAEEAKQAVAPATASYDRVITAASAQLHSASKAVWLWFAAAGAIVLLSLLVGWMVLGFYRHQLADVSAQLQNHKDALPVLQAFYASDAIVCGDRVCVNSDPNGQRFGDKRQYHQAKPRSQP